MKNININHLILNKLKDKERSVAWLARQIKHNSNNLRRILKNNKEIYPSLIFAISLALEEDFFAHYSQELKEILNAKGKTENKTI